MKKIISLILTPVLILCLFSGCAKKNVKKIKVGLAAPAATHGWVAGVAYYAEKYCEKNEIEYMLTTSANAEEMENNIKKLTDWGMQALVVWPQWSGMEKTIDKVISKGISVVSFDVDIASKGVCKVTGNNYDMGYQGAKYIASKVKNGASIAVLSVPSAGSVSLLRIQGFYDYLNEIGYDTSNIFEVEEEAFSRDCGYNDMIDILKNHKKVDAVFSLDDEVSIGIVKAITEEGRTDIKAITGGGGMQEYFNMINNPTYSGLGLASVLYSPAMIEEAINAASEIFNSDTPSKTIIIPTKVISADNVKQYIDKANTVY